jgi:HSP20 family protein
MSHPEDPFKSLQREAERLFHDLVYRRHPASHFAEHPWSPPADLVVSRQSARVLFELAGVPKESIRVRLAGRTLEVSGRRNPPQETQGAKYHRAEIYFGDFRRVVDLPWEADRDRVEAIYRDGMLEVKLRCASAERIEIPVEERGAVEPDVGPREPR